MIQRKTDGLTLFYIDGNGQEISATPMQERYWDLDRTLNAQLAANTANTAAQSKYMADLHDYQVAIDTKGIAVAGVAPTKPLMKVVSNLNAVTFAPFPNLPDPVIPKVTPSAPIGPEARPVSLNPVEQLMFATLMALHAKVDRLIAKGGA